ncbi:MAG: hypothetical protein PUP91_28715 [Rhizonema sp. PD37]|nr:hypothetical protein [Rhizonema sp. PD37]
MISTNAIVDDSITNLSICPIDLTALEPENVEGITCLEALKTDFTKASLALQSIKEKPEILEEFDLAVIKFRHAIGEDLNQATYTYVLNTLINQRLIDSVNHFDSNVGVKTLASGSRTIASVCNVGVKTLASGSRIIASVCCDHGT